MLQLLIMLLAIVATTTFRSNAPITAYVIGSLCFTAWQGRHAGHLQWYRRMTPLMLIQNMVVLAAIFTVAIGLLELDNPILNFGWYTVLEQSMGHDDGGGNIITAPLSYPLLFVPFLLLLLFVFPRLAETEEVIFRRGTRDWRMGIRRSLLFGLVHMTVGMPLAVALTLSIGGLWFTYQFFQGGTARSTAYHLAYNLLVLVLIVVVTIVR
ncbi:MAG: hypothetical protein NVSMB52_18910 [Chloroflexota bacterium]